MDLRTSSIPMTAPGSAARNQTISETTYIPFPIDQVADNSKMARDLRNSHFVLGNDGFQGVPEYKAAYIRQGFLPNAMNEASAKDIRSSHINYLFDPANAKRGFKSTYQERISDNAGKGAPQPAVKHNLQRSNFVIGTDDPDFTTEMKSKYVNHGRVETPANDSGRRPNLETIPWDGSGKMDYTTEARARFTRPVPDATSLDAAKSLAKDLRREHFKLGNEPGDMATHYHIYYNKIQKDREAAKFNQDQLNDIKKSHFYLGDKSRIGITHYTDQHRWLQPVPKLEPNDDFPSRTQYLLTKTNQPQ